MTPTTPDREGTGQSFYFGCARGIGWRREAGHYLYFPSANGSLAEPGWEKRDRLNAVIPWGSTPDGTLAPREPGYQKGPEMPQGVAALHHKDGWTALSFWDRSGDSRGNSSSTFMFDEILDFEQALARAREQFPQLFERFPFEVVPA